MSAPHFNANESHHNGHGKCSAKRFTVSEELGEAKRLEG
jgi:hypothetical protein